MLRAREGDVERGIPIDPTVGRITFDEAAADLLNDYKANRKRTYVDAKRRIKKHLAPFFGNRRMITITTTELRAFVAKRLTDGTPVRQKRRRGAMTKGLHQTSQGSQWRPVRSTASSRCSRGCTA